MPDLRRVTATLSVSHSVTVSVSPKPNAIVMMGVRIYSQVMGVCPYPEGMWWGHGELSYTCDPSAVLRTRSGRTTVQNVYLEEGGELILPIIGLENKGEKRNYI